MSDWSSAFDGIEQYGVDLGVQLRVTENLAWFVCTAETMQAIAERINTLSVKLAQHDAAWSGEAADTGLPVITVRELPPFCPLNDDQCPYVENS